MFSERYGLQDKELQINNMDEDLRNSLWIIIEEVFDEIQDGAREGEIKYERYRDFLKFIWTDFIKKPQSNLTTINCYHIIHSKIHPIYEKFDWHQVYSFIEFVAKLLTAIRPNYVKSFEEDCNSILERENSGWRFINNIIVPIIDAHEIQCIETALSVKKQGAKHLTKSLQFLVSHDYRSCSSEAINALEGYAREVSGEKSMVLSDMCKKNKLPVHKTMSLAIEKLYAYASDEIRHAEKEGSPPITYDHAIFMLNQCASYINIIHSLSVLKPMHFETIAERDG